MRIAFINQPLDCALPPNQGSIAIWTYQVARRLARAHDVVVYGTYSRRRPPVDRAEGIRFRFLRTVPQRVFSALTRPLVRRRRRPLFASPLYHPEYVLRVAYDLRRFRPDVVHVNNYSQFVPVVRAMNPDAAIVLHMQCQWLTQLDRQMIGTRLAQTDLIVGCSEFICKGVRRVFPHLAPRCETVFNGVDVDHFRPRERHANGKRILFVGRVSPEKGVHTLLGAFERICDRVPGVQLDIAGPLQALPLEFIVGLDDDPKVIELARFYSSDYAAQLRQRLRPAVAQRVRFIGEVAHADTRGLYQEADLLVNPALTEAFGIPIVESMACGVPVIGSRVGGIPEIIEHERSGLLVPPDSEAEVAEALLCLLQDDARRAAMGRAGRERVLSLFAWEPIIDRLVGLYSGLRPRA